MVPWVAERCPSVELVCLASQAVAACSSGLSQGPAICRQASVQQYARPNPTDPRVPQYERANYCRPGDEATGHDQRGPLLRESEQCVMSRASFAKTVFFEGRHPLWDGPPTE